MLRCYCSENPGNWDDAMPMLEFHYNNSVNASTRHSPFMVNYGYNPRFGISRQLPNVEATQHQVVRLQDIWQ